MGHQHFFLFAFFSCLYTVVASAAPPTNLLQLSTSDNATSPVNLRLTSPLNALPADDPVDYHIPSSTQTLTFANFTRLLPPIDALTCLLQGTATVIRELNTGHDRRIDQHELQTSSNAVYLILHPGSEMTYGMWGDTLRGLVHFVKRWETVDLDFLVKEEGVVGIVGSGMFVYV